VIEHRLSILAPLSGFLLITPLLAAVAALEIGPFADSEIASERGALAQFLAPGLWATIFVGMFVVFLTITFFVESGRKREINPIDIYKRDRHWEMWLILLSEVIFFGALIGSSLAIRLNATDWPSPSDYLNVNLTAINTFILLASSFTMAMAINSIKLGDQRKLKTYLLATLVLGATFITIQILEYKELFAENQVALTQNAELKLYSSTFFLQTGLHGLHVLIGLIFIGFILLRASRGGYSKNNYEYVEYVGLYWHFVDLVWVFLFMILYLI
jgi:heme/copper-type cytochrome/quinol oxidase subunit 3